MRDLIEEFEIIIYELICIRNINANLHFNNITVDDLGTQSINSALLARNNPNPAW